MSKSGGCWDENIRGKTSTPLTPFNSQWKRFSRAELKSHVFLEDLYDILTFTRSVRVLGETKS